MVVAFVVLVGVIVIGAGSVLAPRLKVPLPLLLVVLGVALAFLPGLGDVALDPDLVLDGLLPPLLYSAAVQASLVDLKRTAVLVLAFAVAPVVLTALGVGLVLALVVPAVGFAAAFALGAAVAPPDAVSATALGRSVGMPRPLVELLGDESLLNDPVALTLQSVALTAITTASVSAGAAGLELGLSVVGGLGVGLAIGLAVGLVRRRIADPVLSTLVSFAAPYLAFVPTELVHGSGFLAVVVTGLIAAQQRPTLQNARVRIVEGVTWRTVSFALENGVFLLIGLQLPALIGAVRDRGIGEVLLVCGLVLAVVVVARFVFAYGAWAVAQLTPARDVVRLRGVTVLGWAGMRGVVTLAGAFLLPANTPEREVLQLAAFVVVGGTLLLQGLTLGPLVRALHLRAPDPAEDALATAVLTDRAVAAGAKRLDELLTGDEPEHVVRALRSRNDAQSRGAWERLGDAGVEPPTAVYRRLRGAMLQAEREVVLQARDTGAADQEVLQEAFRRLDQEESTLDGSDDLDGDRLEELTAPRRGGTESCDHLRDARDHDPATPGECEDCVREGTTWVHLRTCLTCGHVGCCDSSERQHATGHFRSTQHPVMRSAEPGEAWRWCYVHTLLG